MRARDGPHAFHRRLIVEQNPAAAIDLEIDEAGRQEGAVRQPSLRPVAWNLALCRQSPNAAVLNQHSGIVAPAAAVENPVPGDGLGGMLSNGICTLRM